jgi:hypothetical protein
MEFWFWLIQSTRRSDAIFCQVALLPRADGGWRFEVDSDYIQVQLGNALE